MQPADFAMARMMTVAAFLAPTP